MLRLARLRSEFDIRIVLGRMPLPLQISSVDVHSEIYVDSTMARVHQEHRKLTVVAVVPSSVLVGTTLVWNVFLSSARLPPEGKGGGGGGDGGGGGGERCVRLQMAA